MITRQVVICCDCCCHLLTFLGPQRSNPAIELLLKNNGWLITDDGGKHLHICPMCKPAVEPPA